MRGCGCPHSRSPRRSTAASHHALADRVVSWLRNRRRLAWVPIMPQIPVKHDLTAEEHLAEDRRLFQRVEDGEADYAWRVWETAAPAVVLGRFGCAAEEVFEAHCERDGVPLVRR